MATFPGKPSSAQSPASVRPRGGCRRAVLIGLAAVLALAVLGALFIVVGLPVIGCPKAGNGAPTGAVSEFCFTPFTGGGHAIGALVAGPDGALWFTEGSRIGRITPQGAITEFNRPATDTTPGPIVVGPDGNLWFVEQSAKALGRITPQGVMRQFPLPPGDTEPVGLAAGPDGSIWYTRSPNTVTANGPPNVVLPGLIGRMTVSGTATEFALSAPPAPRPPAQPRDIVAGPDGALWFDTGSINGVNNGDGWIGRITTSGQASIVYLPDVSALLSIASLAAGPDHNLWFTAMGSAVGSAVPSGGPPPIAGIIGRLAPSGTVKLFPLAAIPGPIIAGPDGNLWFAAAIGQFGRITPTGQLTTFAIHDAQATISSVAEGPGHAVWFTVSFGDVDLLDGLVWGTKIGRISV